MITGLRTRGYTVVEVLIFLAVTSALFASAIVLISGQQGKAEFEQGVRDFESQMIDLANNVSSGYYIKTGDFSCRDDGIGVPDVRSNSPKEQGTNQGCTFVGTVIQLAPAGKADHFVVYTSVGLQRNSNGTEVSSLSEAEPVLIYPTGLYPNIPQRSFDYTLASGITITKLFYSNGAGNVNIGGFGFFSTFGSSPNGALLSGTISTQLIPIAGTGLNNDQQTFASAADTVANLAPANPKRLSMCLKSAGSRQSAILVYGANNGTLTSKLTFFSSGNCT
ncbi:MAG TPA: hypothetical protein VLE69_01635 [Candidatus Saccharimonadales bacterium]|nr:hypothetical protein [Candidatus Saccharimonadales bacterium]